MTGRHFSKSTSANTIPAFFPPSFIKRIVRTTVNNCYIVTSRDSFLQYGAVTCCILCPIIVLPVNDTRGTSGCVVIASPALGPVPKTILQTPGGSPNNIKFLYN